ncbi:DUF7546 family protein [Halobacterium bonnevillei]|uniref:Uncharacterized protein n=1 Tax=Halobacterium bonnevillei TaxID=2692200 RepID=A0A6B0SLS8_9EURY|nr:hypothetical protein [Halobacterium bonnevillei]MXR20473.1 hypothetical protein [Halobacterium bonnevillei]
MTRSQPSRPLAAVSDRVSGASVALLVAVVLAELALVVGYLGATAAEATSVRYLLYPFVWINVAVAAVFATKPPDAGPWLRRGVLVVAGGYLLVLAYFGGVLELTHLGHSHSHGGASGLTVFTSLPPGWGPTVVYDHALFSLTLVPYQFVGYLALAYLVYAALLDTASAAFSGAVGLLSCVSCSWPVLASLLAGVLGGSAVASTVYSFSVDLSTAAFVLAVVLLVWRPGAR